jgi:hypothetical protein
MFDPATKAAFASLVETMRERIPDPATLPDFGFDPGFLDKTAPVLEFLWSRYFRIAVTGMDNIPEEGAQPSWLRTIRAACPTTAPC